MEDVGKFWPHTSAHRGFGAGRAHCCWDWCVKSQLALPFLTAECSQTPWGHSWAVALAVRAEGFCFVALAALKDIFISAKWVTLMSPLVLPSPCQALGIRGRWVRALRYLGWPWGGSNYNSKLQMVNAVSRLRVWHSGKSQDLVLCCYFSPMANLQISQWLCCSSDLKIIVSEWVFSFK